MSQQEFVPRSQAQRGQAQEGQQETYHRPKKKTGEVPKNEHPSTFDNFIPPYSYQAQDNIKREEQPRRNEQPTRMQEQQWRQRFSPDGDALEHGYRPYTTWEVPSWARPQHHNRRRLRLTIIMIALLVLIKPLLVLITFLLAAVAGVAILVILLPIILFLFMLIVFSIVGVIVFPLLLRRARRNGWRRRGPWTGITWNR